MPINTLYGIKNCDTMKKAIQWLNDNNIEYNFCDYKKSGANEALLKRAIAEYGWENVINRRGATWRKLPDKIKNDIDENTAIALALENPSIIKRPLLIYGTHIELGFNQETYKALFKS